MVWEGAVLLYAIIWGLAFWFIVSTYMAVLIPLYLLKALGRTREAWFYLGAISRIISRFLFFSTGTKLHVEGLENIPRDRPYCYISNHQAYADILAMMASTPKAAGYIAKASLKNLPIVRTWMILLGCYFLKRDSLKDGLKGILYGADRVKKGYPMVIFPEGHRSKGPTVKPFRKGGVKLATKAKAVAIPVSIHGSYRLLEQKGYPKPTWIGVRFHAPIDTAKLTSAEEDALSDTLHTMIQNGVAELQKLSPRR
jgi:1-acyl-sn-glycerol-3-phosphate acyltransferase